MMSEVARVCREQGITSCQLSLERAMACGVGVCMGCVVKACKEHDPACGAGATICHSERSEESGNPQSAIRNQQWLYSRTCTDGPVYEAKELIWE